MNLYVSLKASWWGGGANTFSGNLTRWAKHAGLRVERKITHADLAIIIADHAQEEALREARKQGVFIIHRLDEHFEPDEDAYRRQKHSHIQRLNQHCDVTVFQSEFVKQNVLPHLHSKRHAVILNGGDPACFRPAEEPGALIGHVTWGVGDKKRLDLLEKAIREHPNEHFLLVGNHAKSKIDFRRFPNVRLVGRTWRWMMPWLYRKMKALYFPSENDPCPNTAIEAILSGVPVIYNPLGGTQEVVRDCGLPLEQSEDLLRQIDSFRERCRQRRDLHFDQVALKYFALVTENHPQGEHDDQHTLVSL